MRPLPEADTLRELLELMLLDGGYAGVDHQQLAVFAAYPRCKCGAMCTVGRGANCLRPFGGDCSHSELEKRGP